jgi:hypothetical protein
LGVVLVTSIMLKGIEKNFHKVIYLPFSLVWWV